MGKRSYTLEDLETRMFAKRLITPEGCWEYTGSRVPQGYGQLSFQAKRHRAHRLAAFLWLGLDLGSGRAVMVLHQCDNPPCFNPDHLRLGTQRENMAEAIQRGRWDPAATKGILRSHCPQGHEYTSENTMWVTDGKTGRKYQRCRTCRRAGNRIQDRRRGDATRQGEFKPRLYRRLYA